ncbi:hypothetical protein [Piscinibacter sp.]|uniref:hypothetical protein n=1 Tax=Piscinibacter sp. TaxID=1903157 RepID=UPI002CE71E5B|nr:hypothetical protein [Albitalea sp.]HUG24462.1 hypothetical protein [Albitalea sp.]
MKMNRVPLAITLLSVAAAFAAPDAHADAVTDWNLKSGELITDAKLGTPPAARVMAIVQTAALQAVEGAQQRQASAEAALAAAHRVVLTRLLPAQQPAIDAAYQAALNGVAGGAARSNGISAGEAAAHAVLAARAKGGGAMPVLATSSPTVKGATRRWQRTDEFVREVSDARVHGGIHFRSATTAAEAMGRRIGELAVQQVLQPAP